MADGAAARFTMRGTPQPIPLDAGPGLRLAPDLALSAEVDCVRVADLYGGLVNPKRERERKRVTGVWHKIRRESAGRDA